MRLPIVLFLLVTQLSMSAQVSFGFQLAQPMGEFFDNVDIRPSGHYFRYTSDTKNPVRFGLQYERLSFEKDKFDYQAATVINQNTVDGLNAIFEIGTPDNPENNIEVYVDGSVGIDLVNTSTRVRNGPMRLLLFLKKLLFPSDDDCSCEEEDFVARFPHIPQTRFSYGGGIGTRIRLDESTQFELSANYREGAKASYYQKRDFEDWYYDIDSYYVDESIIEPTNAPTTSTMNRLVFKVGITSRF